MPRTDTSENNPPRPTGSSSEAFFMQWVYDQITRHLQMLDTDEVRFQRTTKGIIPTLRPRQGGGGPPAGMKYLGEWSASVAYVAQSMVTRGTLGEFIAVLDVPAGNVPEAGAPYWHGIVYPPPGVWA